MKRLTGAILILTALWLSLGFSAPAVAKPAAVVRVHPATVMLNPGESTTIEIWVDDVVELFGFEIEVRFDPKKISASSLALGEFLEPGLNLINAIDNENGFINYEMAQLGQEVESKSGSGVLIRFEVTLLEAINKTTLELSSVLLTDRDSFEIDYSVEDGFIRTPGMGPEFMVYLPLIVKE
jgi:hypothetical protein